MKTICIYHSIDLDGWMSAAIVKLWAERKDIQVDFIGYNYGDPIPDYEGYDKVIMCDISFPMKAMEDVARATKWNLLWVDHHMSAINDYKQFIGGGEIFCMANLDDKFAACELTWKQFFPKEEMPEIVRLLGRYDCFGHKGTDEEQQVLEFQYGARSYIDSYEKAFSFLINDIKFQGDYTRLIQNSGKDIYKYLYMEAKQSYTNGFEILLTEHKDNATIGEQVKRFICINKERFNPINFGINYHTDGYDGAACFHYDGRVWAFSLYNDNGEVDVSQIAKQYGGGGHKGAAGFRVNDIEQFFKDHSSVSEKPVKNKVTFMENDENFIPAGINRSRYNGYYWHWSSDMKGWVKGEKIY